MNKPYSFRQKYNKPLTSIKGPWVVEGPSIYLENENRTEAAMLVRHLNTAYEAGYNSRINEESPDSE